MAFEEVTEHAKGAGGELSAYTKNKIAYYKLDAFKKAMQGLTKMSKAFIVGTFVFGVLFFASFAAATALGEFFSNSALGFLAVAGIYLLVGLLIIFLLKKPLERYILKTFAHLIYEDTALSTPQISTFEDMDKALRILDLKAKINKETAQSHVEEAKDSLTAVSTLGSLAAGITQKVVVRAIARKIVS